MRHTMEDQSMRMIRTLEAMRYVTRTFFRRNCSKPPAEAGPYKYDCGSVLVVRPYPSTRIESVDWDIAMLSCRVLIRDCLDPLLCVL